VFGKKKPEIENEIQSSLFSWEDFKESLATKIAFTEIPDDIKTLVRLKKTKQQISEVFQLVSPETRMSLRGDIDRLDETIAKLEAKVKKRIIEKIAEVFMERMVMKVEMEEA